MIQPLFNGIIALMLTKFMMNDVPHAVGLSPSPKSSSDPVHILYHVTYKDNLDSIMKKGLLSGKGASGMLFFLPTLEFARESGLTSAVILEVRLTENEINKCEIGEVFPDLYEEKFGKPPPEDATYRSYLSNPLPYGVPEIFCTINKILPSRIKYVESIS